MSADVPRLTPNDLIRLAAQLLSNYPINSALCCVKWLEEGYDDVFLSTDEIEGNYGEEKSNQALAEAQRQNKTSPGKGAE